jgi:hypothetical protein
MAVSPMLQRGREDHPVAGHPMLGIRTRVNWTCLQKHQVFAHLLGDAIHDRGTLANATLSCESSPPRKLESVHAGLVRGRA